MYAGLALIMDWTFRGRLLPPRFSGLCAITAFAAGYGALMEILQGLMIWTERSFSWGDILANLAGAIIGTLAASLIRSGKIRETSA